MATSWLSSSRSDPHAEVHDNLAFAALLLLLVWVPIPLGSNRVLPAAVMVAWSVLVLLAVLWAWRSRLPDLGGRLATFAVPAVCLILLMGWVWLQTLPLPGALLQWWSPEAFRVQQGVSAVHTISLDVNQTRLYAALTVGYACAFMATVACVRDRGRLEKLVMVMVLTALVQSVLAIVLLAVKARYFVFYTEIRHATAVGTFVNRNHFAGFLEMALSVGVGLMVARVSHKTQRLKTWKDRVVAGLRFMLSNKMVLRLMLVIMVIALVLTRSRMGNTGFFAAMLVVGGVTLVLTRRSAPAMVALITSLLVVDVVIVGTWVGLEKVTERMQGPQLARDVDFRADVALHAQDLVADFWLTGSGAGSFYNTYLRYRSLMEGYFDHAHHDYLELWADFGLIGLCLFAVLVLSTVWVSLVNIRRRRSALPRGISFGVLMAIVAIAIHSFVDFNLQIPSNALWMVVILAMGWVSYRLPSAAGRSRTGDDQLPVTLRP